MAELAQPTPSPQARLRKQIFTSLRFGIPLTALGAGICVGAFLLGLDVQGWFVLACGIIVVTAGAAMLLLAIGSTVLFAEAAVRGWLRKRRKPKVKRPDAAATATAAVPPLPAAVPEPPKGPGGPGPLVF